MTKPSMTEQSASIQIFENDEFGPVRTTTYKGEIAFVAQDVTERLRYRPFHPNLIAHVPDEWKGRNRITTPGGMQEMLVLTEAGLFFFLARSDKPLALPFQKWIAGEVLPSIRKTGSYSVNRQSEDERILDVILTLQNRVSAQQAKIDEDQAKVEFADAVAESDTDILVGTLAKILNQNDDDTGQNRLFERLRNQNFLGKFGEFYNVPTQRAMDMGLFHIKVTVIKLKNGITKTCITPMVTAKGQIYFVHKFLNEEKLKSIEQASTKPKQCDVSIASPEIKQVPQQPSDAHRQTLALLGQSSTQQQKSNELPFPKTVVTYRPGSKDGCGITIDGDLIPLPKDYAADALLAQRKHFG